MSRSTTTTKLSQIPCGTHLVAPITANVIKGHDNLPVITKDGAKGVTIRFGETTEQGHLSDHDFWVPSSQYAKFCRAMNVDSSKPFREQVIGKALWICVREVKSMSGDKQVGSRNEIFDFIECVDVLQKPIVSGDPCQHLKGIPLGVFVEYEQVEAKANWVSSDEFATFTKGIVDDPTQETRALSNKLAAEGITQDVVGGYNTVTEEFVKTPGRIDFAKKLREEQAAKLALGKKIIAEGEKKEMSSLNQKNIPDTFEEELKTITPGESEDNAEDDWDNL